MIYEKKHKQIFALAATGPAAVVFLVKMTLTIQLLGALRGTEGAKTLNVTRNNKALTFFCRI